MKRAITPAIVVLAIAVTTAWMIPSMTGPWRAMPGQAADIAAGADTSVFAVAPSPGNDGAVYQWQDEAFAWMNVGGKAARIAVEASGRPWVITNDKKIYRLRGATWQAMPGDAIDIGTGSDGSVWVVGASNKMFKWNEESFSWQDLGGKAKRIAVDSDGRPWVVTGDNKIFRLRGTTWQAMPGDAVDIGAGADGTVYVASPRGKAYEWNDDAFAWQDQGGDNITSISVGPRGDVWVVTSDNKIYWQAPKGGGM